MQIDGQIIKIQCTLSKIILIPYRGSKRKVDGIIGIFQTDLPLDATLRCLQEYFWWRPDLVLSGFLILNYSNCRS